MKPLSEHTHLSEAHQEGLAKARTAYLRLDRMMRLLGPPMTLFAFLSWPVWHAISLGLLKEGWGLAMLAISIIYLASFVAMAVFAIFRLNQLARVRKNQNG